MFVEVEYLCGYESVVMYIAGLMVINLIFVEARIYRVHYIYLSANF